MDIDEMLGRLDLAQGQGTDRWSARCPAHADRSPSLSIRVGERGLLLKCWAGCTIEEICQALGCRVADLFWSNAHSGVPHRAIKATTPSPQLRFDSDATAWRFRHHATLLWLRATAVLDAARKLDVSAWTDAELDAAMRAVDRAYHDRERADLLEEVAFRLHVKGLGQEDQHVVDCHAA